MSPGPVDLYALRERLAELNGKLAEAVDQGRRPHGEDPALVGDALVQLFGVLPRLGTGDREVSTLGDYGLHLFDDLARVARRLGQDAAAAEIERLALPFALWLVRNGGEIRTLAPVVNAVAFFASQDAHPGRMGALYAHCSELIDAVSPAAQEDATDDPSHPWRLLVLNRATIATRSHKPDLVEAAFDAVVEWLPDDAQRFLAEAMEQTAMIDCPQPVRDTVRRYYLAHCARRHLH